MTAEEPDIECRKCFKYCQPACVGCLYKQVEHAQRNLKIKLTLATIATVIISGGLLYIATRIVM